MTQASIADLTEKEKEALRLLLSGHDAKSSAIELDISVHALNDRLRSARRKLSVSSSREAARILGDAEGTSPQNAARNPFGMETMGSGEDNAVLNQTRQSGPSRALWLTGGMLIMSLTIAAIALISISSTPDEGTATAPAGVSRGDPADQDFVAKPESYERAVAFISFVDAGDWQGSWDVSGAYFRSQVTADQWAKQVKPVREPLGAVRSRELFNVQRTQTLPGAPVGEYEVVQYQTEFANAPGRVIETLVMMMGENGWEVSGYFVRPA
jgi:DNA-binding CsgD family transcriptional regulator